MDITEYLGEFKNMKCPHCDAENLEVRIEEDIIQRDTLDLVTGEKKAENCENELRDKRYYCMACRGRLSNKDVEDILVNNELCK